jgi:hypothetical protein
MQFYENFASRMQKKKRMLPESDQWFFITNPCLTATDTNGCKTTRNKPNNYLKSALQRVFVRQSRQFYFSRLEAEQQREILAPCHGEQRNRQGEGKRNNVDYNAKLGGVPQPHLQMRHTTSCTKQSRESAVKTFEEDR